MPERRNEHPAATTETERKIAAYDAARATVKIEGNTRAYYVLRAEAAEEEVERLREALNEIIDMPIDEAKSAGFHFAEVRRIAREAMQRGT